MSEVTKVLEEVVAAVKKHVDNGDSPFQILHTVAAIRNTYRDAEQNVVPIVETAVQVAEEVEADVVSIADRVAAAKSGKDVAALVEELGVELPTDAKTIAQKVEFLKTHVEELAKQVEGAEAGTSTAGTAELTITDQSGIGDAGVTTTGEGTAQN